MYLDSVKPNATLKVMQLPPAAIYFCAGIIYHRAADTGNYRTANVATLSYGSLQRRELKNN